MKLPYNARICFIGACTVYALLFQGTHAYAQSITINQPLSFGKFVLVNNNAVRDIELLSGGSFNADPEYTFYIDPQMGNVTLDGYDPLTIYTVTIGTTTVGRLGGGGAADFSTGSTFTVPTVITTDGSGSATFDVGATLSSDGGGNTHSDDDYDGNFSVTVTP